MEVVIMGCGRVGSLIALALAGEGNTVKVIDLRKDAFDRIPRAFIDDGKIVPLVGDGTLERYLRAAGIQEAGMFIAVSASDLSNVLAGQIAKHIYEVPRVICRTNDPVRQQIYSELGLTTVSATHVVAQTALRAAHS